jgi:hypothetical protein
MGRDYPKFITFEELVKDHERLCGEVEELKKEFASHRHSKRDVREEGVDKNFFLGPEKFTGLPVK